MSNTTEMKREEHAIDAAGQSVGRLASEIAIILQGKNKPTYQPHIDNGDSVTVSNVSQMKFTGKKLDQKQYHRYSGYPGGITTTSAKKQMDENPQAVLRRAVELMLPSNKLRSEMLKRLIIE